MIKLKPCGLDYCPLAEIVPYASCLACAWGNNGDNELEEALEEVDDEESY